MKARAHKTKDPGIDMSQYPKVALPAAPTAVSDRPSNALAATDLVMHNVGTVSALVGQLDALVFGSREHAPMPEELQAPTPDGVVCRMEYLAAIANWRLLEAERLLKLMLKSFDTPTS